MKTLPLFRLAARLTALCSLATALLLVSQLRAEDPPAPPAGNKQPGAVAALTPPAPAVVAPESSPEAAERLAEQAHAEAEHIAEKARVDAETAVAKAHAEAESLAEAARAHAEEAAENARGHAEEIAEQAHAAARLLHGKVEAAADHPARKHRRHKNGGDDDHVTVGSDNVIAVGEKVPGDVVAVTGDLTVDGEVAGDAVAVIGNNTINGTVRGDTVVVAGKLTLGPKAVVDGDVVVVGGALDRDPEATVHGHPVVIGIGSTNHFEKMSSWWTHGLSRGRPLAIGAHLGWLWVLTAFSVACYALLGLIFPEKLRSCGDRFVAEPGMSILAGLLALLGLPVVFVLLCITIIGLPVALLVLPLGTLLVAMYGTAALYGLVGRKLDGDRYPLAVSVILGALVFVLLYLVPVLGLIVSLLVWFLGFGCAVRSIFNGKPKPPLAPTPAAPPPAAAPVPPVMPAAAPGLAPASVAAEVVPDGAIPVSPAEPAPGAAPTMESLPPPVGVPPVPPIAPPPVATPVPTTADTLPRAGFWIRLAATFLDFLLVLVVGELLLNSVLRVDHDGPGLAFLALAGYHMTMWKLKGTTIGGVICHLKVVRLDDRPIDWGVAAVRVLTAFLSLLVAGLGFIWVAFDAEKQSWHDKVAGTTIVRVPKGTSLL